MTLFNIPRFALVAGLLLSLLNQSALAGDDALLTKNRSQLYSIGIPVNDPTFCFGMNSMDECVLFLGSQSSCDNVSPCTGVSPATQQIKEVVAEAVVGTDDLTFCYGADDLTGQCKLFAGTASQCEHVEPCGLQFKRIEQKAARRP